MASPAEELTAAAHKLRALAEAAAAESGNPRWVSTRAFPEQPDSTASVVWAEGAGPVFRIARTSYVRGPIADYVAAMGPAVGLALADWLDSAARAAREIGPDPHALAVARAINGTSHG